MDIRTSEVSKIIKDQIGQLGKTVEYSETGEVIKVGDGIARVYGLDHVQAGEMVEFSNKTMGMAINLESDNVGVMIFGNDSLIKEGDTVKRTKNIMQVPTGKGFPSFIAFKR